MPPRGFIGAAPFSMKTLTLYLASFLVLSAGSAGVSQRSGYSTAAAEQTTATLTTRAYVGLIRAHRSDNSSDTVSELAARNSGDVRNAVASAAQALQTAGERLRELRAVEERWRNGEVEQSKYAALRSSTLKRLEDAVKTIGIDEPLGDVDRLERDLQGLLRGAIGLHTAISARSWRAGRDAAVAEHLEFAKVYVRSLAARNDDAATGLWCRTAGTLLAASERMGDALRTYEQCLEWYPGDAWLQLGRGSVFESVAMLLAALPPGATLAHGLDQPPDVDQLSEQAIGHYEMALKAAPELIEARLRLARVLLVRGDAARAAVTLLRDRPNLETVLRYWASLIAGAVEEAREDYQRAATDYRTALQLYPKAQSAAIALSRVLAERLGRREEALATLRDSVSATVPRTMNDDPWKFYMLGQAWRAADWLREIAEWSRR